MVNNKILILGAGPAGMSCAMELSKKNIKNTIIEKDSIVGGLAKTLIYIEGKYTFRTDIGPHRFFSKNKYLYEFIEDLIHEDWIVVPRQTRQFIDGKFYDYPINAMQAFRNIGPIRASGMFLSYINGVVKYRILKREVKSFEDYIVANFGKKLGEFNMLNYTEKIWGIPCVKVHPDWATQRIKGLNLISAVKNAIIKDKNAPKTLVDEFYYPQYGTGLIYESIKNKIIKSTSKIEFNSVPTKIIHKNKKIVEVHIKNNKENISTTYTPKKLISSIPLTEFVSLLSPQPPKKIIFALKKLRWRSQVYLFITLDKKQITKDNWIYFPNKDIPFGRIAEMKNFSKNMSPKDKTSLFVEFFVNENDEVWNMNKEQLFNYALPHFEKLGFFKEKDVRNYYLIKRKKVYPLYDLDYKKYLKIVKEYLNEFINLEYIGRPGRFKYNNQDHSLEMGILAAKSIIENKKYDIEQVGSEKEYYEKDLLHKKVIKK